MVNLSGKQDLEHSPTAIQLTNVINYIQNQEEHQKKNIQRRICRILKLYNRF
jgi:hypothetical protein